MKIRITEIIIQINIEEIITDLIKTIIEITIIVGIITTIITEEIMMKLPVGHVNEQVIYQQIVQKEIITTEMKIITEMEEMKDVLIILTLKRKMIIQMKKICMKRKNYFVSKERELNQTKKKN